MARPPIVLHRIVGVVLTGASAGLTVACAHAPPPPNTNAAASTAPTATPATAALDMLDGALERLKQSEPRPGQVPAAADWKSSLERTQKDVRWLRRRAPRWPDSPALEALVTTVRAQVALLDERFAQTALPPTLLEDVARDIAIKAQQCRLFGGPVPVSVNVVTKDHVNQEVSGYEVWFVRKGFEDMPREYRRFDRHSSPAARVFNDPGYYLLWLERQGPSGERVRGERVDVEIGPEQRLQEIDLLAPIAWVAP